MNENSVAQVNETEELQAPSIVSSPAPTPPPYTCARPDDSPDRAVPGPTPPPYTCAAK